MNSYLKMTHVQLKLFLREPVALFFTIAFPLLLLFLFGAMFGNDPFPGSEFGYIDSEVPALAGLTIGTIALMSIPIATSTAREQRVLRRYKATPLPPFVYFASEVTANLLVAFLGLGMLIICGKLFYGLRFGGNWLAVMLAFILSTLAFVSVGYIIASLAPTSRIAQVVGQVIYFPMMFLSGAAFPQEIMPDSLISASNFLPMTHMVTLLQETWFGNAISINAVIILLAMMGIGTIISMRVFRWE